MYIFTFPKAADFPFTFDGLDEYLKAGRDFWKRKVGTTVTVERSLSQHFIVKLYDTEVAIVGQDGSVTVPLAINDHGSQATTKWVAKVLQDNGLGTFVYREKGEYVGVAGKTFRPAA